MEGKDGAKDVKSRPCVLSPTAQFSVVCSVYISSVSFLVFSGVSFFLVSPSIFFPFQPGSCRMNVISGGVKGMGPSEDGPRKRGDESAGCVRGRPGAKSSRSGGLFGIL